jgi:hypothetical protein
MSPLMRKCRESTLFRRVRKSVRNCHSCASQAIFRKRKPVRLYVALDYATVIVFYSERSVRWARCAEEQPVRNMGSIVSSDGMYGFDKPGR